MSSDPWATRQVINDLWPAYTAGEASPDTRALVEAFFRQDPAFAKVLQELDAELLLLQQEIPRLPPDHEAKALRRTRRLVHGWDWTLFMAMLFSCFAFGRIVADTSWDVSPANFIATASIAVAFWVAFFVRLIWMRKQVFRTRIGAGAPRA
jgi:anti-sigma factor RsiW